MPTSFTVTPLEGTRFVKTYIGRHFGTAERILSRLECVFFSPYGHKIFIEIQKPIFKSTFYQKVLAKFGPQNWYSQNFALDPWRHLLRYKPGFWGWGRPAKDLRGRKVWGKTFDGKGSEHGSKFFVSAPFLPESERVFRFPSSEL